MESAIARITENSWIPGYCHHKILDCHFVDGDFWHVRGHQDNPGEQIKNNKEFWSKNSRRNVERDKDNDAALTDLGWLVLHFWESDIKKIWTVV